MNRNECQGGHVTASLDLGPLLDKVRPTAEDRFRFIRAAMQVSTERPTEGLSARVTVNIDTITEGGSHGK